MEKGFRREPAHHRGWSATELRCIQSSDASESGEERSLLAVDQKEDGRQLRLDAIVRSYIPRIGEAVCVYYVQNRSSSLIAE